MLMGSGYGMGAFMWIFWIALIALIVWAFVAITARSRPSAGGGSETPMDVLKKRLARGEIDAEEYRRLKTELDR